MSRRGVRDLLIGLLLAGVAFLGVLYQVNESTASGPPGRRASRCRSCSARCTERVRRLHARADRRRRGGAARPPRRVRAAAAPAPRPPAHAHDVASRRAAAGPGLHRRLPRPARLRRVDRAADDARPRAVLQARDGRRHARADARGSGSSASRSPGTTAARTSRCGSRSTRRRRSPGSRCSTPCRSSEALERCDAQFAADWWHWFFFAQTAKPAEEWISRDPEAWYTVDPDKMGAENHADWRRAVHDPATVHAMVEDYRAGLGHRPRARRGRPRAPAGASPARRSPRGRSTTTWRSSTAIRWRSGAAWADDLRGARIDSGHHMAEEAPDQLAAELRAFLA